MRVKMKRYIGFMMSLLLILGFMPGMTLTVRADDTTGTKITSGMTDLSSGTYYISENTTITGGLVVSSGDVIINLNGHTLNQDCSSENSVIRVTGGTLTVNNGTITGGDGGYDHHGGGFYVDGGSVTVNNVTISDNTSSWGGGVFMNSGSFTMNNSHIDGNHSVQGTLDGVYNDAGGVYLDGGTFTMNGGTITGNTVTEHKANGLVIANDGATVNLLGNVFIYDNLDGSEQENLWASTLFGNTTKTFNITGTLGNNAKIGIRSDLNQVFTSSANPEFNDPTKFVSDSSDYKIGKNDAGQLMLVSSSTQIITAANVSATYGDTDKKVSATSDGDGEISYAVKEGSGDYIEVNSSSGALTIKKVPANGKAYVTVKASETASYTEATKDVEVSISKAPATITAKDQNIFVGGTVPDLSNPVLNTHYTVEGLFGEDALTTAPTLVYKKNDMATTPDTSTPGSYDIVPSDASAGDNYTISYEKGTLTISDKGTQTITADDVTATYGDTDKKVIATTDGDGEISYTVKEGSGDYIDVNASTGALTIKKVPTDGKAYVTVTAKETASYTQATKEVTVKIDKAKAVPSTVTANNRVYDGTEKPLVTVTGQATGGTMQYALGENATTEPTVWGDTIPEKTEAGTYYVWYKAKGDKNYSDSDAKCETVKITAKIEAKVTFKVESGSWDDGTKSEQEVSLEGTEGEAPKLPADKIPKAGTKPADGYKEGAWDTVPVAGAEITKDTTYTYTYIKKDEIAKTVTFKVVNGSWNDGKTEAIDVKLSGPEGETLKLKGEDIPAVGTKPADGYKEGTWDKVPEAGAAITEDTVFTYTYVKKDEITKNVTFKVVNGSWNDGAAEEKTVTLTGPEGETLKLKGEDIPAVGTKPADGYKEGAWDKVPEAGAAITEDTTYTYTYVAKDSITKTVTFKVVNGAWNDGKTEAINVILSGKEGDTLKLSEDQIPAVGSNPNAGYKAGSWDVVPDKDTVITEDKVYTYTYEAEEKPVPEIAISMSEITLTPGKENALTATMIPEDIPVTWTSSDSSVAAVDATGVVTGLKVGTATITAKITVEGVEYTASCKVTVVPAGSPMPIPVPSGSGGGEHVHKYVWNTIEATEDTDGELRYQCETCGDIKERVPLTAYNVFNKNTTEKIRNAKKDATVKIETNKWISFHKMVMEALAERPDVTLEISFLDEGYKGKRCTVTIPKGTDTKPLVDKNGFTGFIFLGNKFGMKTN